MWACELWFTGLHTCLLQNPDQKEDDLSAVHVKQGFTTSYVNLTSSDEYGSALNKTTSLQPSKIWNSFKDILVKKEDLNTLQESKDKNKLLSEVESWVSY